MTLESTADSSFPTRPSLLSRLGDWQDDESWREFFDTYWRLIYNVSRKSGLSDAESQDVVQNTFVYLSRRMPRFKYDRTKGSFKSWLRVVTRSRIIAFRRRERSGELLHREPLPILADEAADGVEEIADPAGDALDLPNRLPSRSSRGASG